MKFLSAHHCLAIAGCLILGVTKVYGFSYIDSLSEPAKSPAISTKTSGGYLDSLQNSETTTYETQETKTDWKTTISKTPDDHYAKQNPGAGWAGYKDPMYGGYLDHLSSDADPTNQCVFQVGKKADYGDDIRWGAQVYLDNLN